MLPGLIGWVIPWSRTATKNAGKLQNSRSHRRYCATNNGYGRSKLSEEEKKKLHDLAAIVNKDERKKFYTRLLLKVHEQRCVSNFLVKYLLSPLKDTNIPAENTLHRNVFIAFAWGVIMRNPEEVKTAIIFYQHALQTNDNLVEAYKVLNNREGGDSKSRFDQAVKVVKDSIENIQTLPIGKRMIMLLISKGCLDDIKSGRVLSIYKSFEREQQNIVEAEITTPYELNEHEKTMYKNIMTNMCQGGVNFNVLTKVDPTLEGGYILNIDGKVIDNSWKQQREEYLQRLNATVPFSRA